MTADEWLLCDDPVRLINAVRDRVTPRKFRLVACACVRQIWDRLVDERSRRAVEVAERHADGAASVAELANADGAAGSVWEEYLFVAELSAREAARAALLTCRDYTAPDSVLPLAASAAQLTTINRVIETVSPAPSGDNSPDTLHGWTTIRVAQCEIVRDLFGSLALPAFDPRWRTADTVGLARGIYEDRAFDGLPLLADALMDAGCGDAEVLGRCRSGGVHSRGCFVVDLVLGKE